MEPLQPGKHPVGVVANQVRIDTVRIQNGLRDMRFDFVGKGADDGRQLFQWCSRSRLADMSSALDDGTLSAPSCMIEG